jgi:surface polysaccharide O-acyltransferase-like enzyme
MLADAVPGKYPESVWLVTNFFDSFFQPAVDIFTMFSGFLLLSKKNLLD